MKGEKRQSKALLPPNFSIKTVYLQNFREE
ncbi:germinal histone H4 gene [Rattus norvegicus]|uniref:Germinal histone H4 gene n=1 Tax=Rattus norvegicus TaxID=10116 RepID=A6KNB7_RAT|nr:germinal histone H4 gene [Rattus norvegicus]